MKNLIFSLIMVLGTVSTLGAQNLQKSTIKLTFAEGKDRLLAENVKLLAEYYNIEVAEAQVEQARLWNNPYFIWNAEMYNFAKNTYFQMNNQILVQIEYVFSVTGKRINAIKQANLSKEIASLAFNDVVRGLIAEYSNAYYTLNELQEKEAIYQKTIAQFQDVIELSELKLKLGVSSENDLIRLKTEYLSLNSVLNAIKNERIKTESELKTMLNLGGDVNLETQKVNYKIANNLNATYLLDSAKVYRPDVKMAEKNIQLNELIYKGQKKLAYPDMKLGYQPFDKGSNHVRPYAGMVFELDLPIFNRNQGNISAARVQIEQSKHMFNYVSKELENQINAAYFNLINVKNTHAQFTDDMLQKMDELSINAKANYEKRNISLLEYIDHQRAYVENKMNWIEANTQFYQSINTIHFVVGKEIAF
jgi:cobalt-zinc-cadmium efflux system outer membrane protein